MIGEAALVGDAIFMPDSGTGHCDFPGGDAASLYRSIQRLLALPGSTRLFTCHDYQPGGRELRYETTLAAARATNPHLHPALDETAFVALRCARDARLELPNLILPSVQVNMRAGHLPPQEANGVRYLKIPLDTL